MARKIKSVREKLANETYGNAIPIGADASNIDTTDGSNVQAKINQFTNNLEWKTIDDEQSV